MTKKIIAMVLVVAMMAIALTSCATKLSGSYTATADVLGLAGGSTTYKFSGSKVTIVVTASVLGVEKTTEFEGKYEIKDKDDGTQTITFTFEDEDAGSYNGTLSFSQDKKAKTVSIGGVKYTKD